MHKRYMKFSERGFTIVELLIVVVIIAILAAISTVAYTNIQKRAATSAILNEARQWRDIFEVHKATHGSYPMPTAGNPLTSGGTGSNAQNVYCLGTGFPQSNGVSYCYNVASASSYRAEESTGSYLLSQLSTVGTLPKNSKKYEYENVVGPMLRYNSSSDVQLQTTFPSGTNCSSLGMWTQYGSANRQDCYYKFDYSN